MSRRPGREVEKDPHHVYIHLDREYRPLYVGRTAHPDTRPWDTKRRPWIKTESHEVAVSPAMTFEAATWIEHKLIQLLDPKHNTRPGQTLAEGASQDWRIDRICEVEGVTRATARFAAPYLPTDPDEFEAALARRAEARIELEAEAARTGETPDAVALRRFGELLGSALEPAERRAS